MPCTIFGGSPYLSSSVKIFLRENPRSLETYQCPCQGALCNMESFDTLCPVRQNYGVVFGKMLTDALVGTLILRTNCWAPGISQSSTLDGGFLTCLFFILNAKMYLHNVNACTVSKSILKQLTKTIHNYGNHCISAAVSSYHLLAQSQFTVLSSTYGSLCLREFVFSLVTLRQMDLVTSSREAFRAQMPLAWLLEPQVISLCVLVLLRGCILFWWTKPFFVVFCSILHC